ncbi:MAG: methyltransferase domain-containing protein [Bacteroidota bacterium]|nr:methyltransferase domain-containing protein [Bacteroidota bacterium]
MKRQTLLLLALALFSLTSLTCLDTRPEFSYKVYGNIANYFENEKDLLSFFEFKKGDVVAEIGALKGENIGGLALLTDSITFYVQDINAKTLNQKNFNKVIRKCEKYKKPLTAKFNLCIGTEKSSNLPDAAFDKIVLSATFHEFTCMDEMVTDISKKLKPTGKLYILESHCFGKTHINYRVDETTAIMKKHNFHLVKKDGKDLNGGTGLYRAIYAKDN